MTIQRRANEPVGLANSSFYVRAKQDWAVTQENYRHDQAMYSIGEQAYFLLMWRVEDHLKGYVRHCPRCYDNNDPLLARASNALNQPTQNKCPMCYGTTFEGGVRAKIIRPAVFTDTDDQEVSGEHGTTYPQTLSVESTSDFRFRNGDYVIRADGSRWQLAAPTRVTVRTGFGHPSQGEDSIGYSAGMATLEDQTSVVWMIPPSNDDVKIYLQAPDRYPTVDIDQTNAPLIPDAWTD